MSLTTKYMYDINRHVYLIEHSNEKIDTKELFRHIIEDAWIYSIMFILTYFVLNPR